MLEHLGNNDNSLVDEFRVYGSKFKKALELVNSGKVKLHRFNPSGREIWTVVGREGDHLVTEDNPYCSCRHFHYRVLSDQDDICHHIVGVKVAKRTSRFNLVEFSDEEHSSFIKALLSDFNSKK